MKQLVADSRGRDKYPVKARVAQRVVGVDQKIIGLMRRKQWTRVRIFS
jgi:hypothetical protein